MEKEIIEGYVVKHSVNIGHKRIVFGVSYDENEQHRYMKCKVRTGSFFEHYENAIAGNDYVDVMRLFIKDIADTIEEIDKERASFGLDDVSCLKPDELIPFGEDDDLRGKVLAYKPDVLMDEYRDITNQLYLMESGYGALTAKHHKSCTARNLRTGEKQRVYRYEFAGIVPDDKIPDFAKNTLEKIKQEKKKDEREER